MLILVLVVVISSAMSRNISWNICRGIATSAMPFSVPVLTLLLLTIAAYLPSMASIWTSDDYVQVYGIFGHPMQSFMEALGRSTQGVITPHRMLTTWFIGMGGILGPAVAHMLALVIHILCACLFGGLVWRLFRSPMLVCVASAWFALAPWVSQPVLWWSSVIAMVSTIYLLMAAHFFLNSLSAGTATGRLSWIVMASVAVFLGLCFYDLWVAGFLLFAGLGFAFRLNTHDELQGTVRWRRRLFHVAAMAVPFVLWCGLVAIIGPRGEAIGRLGFSLERLPIVLASIHLRVANWFIGPDWLALWKMGIDALASPLVAFAFVLGSGLLVLILAHFAARPNLKHRSNATIRTLGPTARR